MLKLRQRPILLLLKDPIGPARGTAAFRFRLPREYALPFFLEHFETAFAFVAHVDQYPNRPNRGASMFWKRAAKAERRFVVALFRRCTRPNFRDLGFCCTFAIDARSNSAV